MSRRRQSVVVDKDQEPLVPLDLLRRLQRGHRRPRCLLRRRAVASLLVARGHEVVVERLEARPPRLVGTLPHGLRPPLRPILPQRPCRLFGRRRAGPPDLGARRGRPDAVHALLLDLDRVEVRAVAGRVLVRELLQLNVGELRCRLLGLRPSDPRRGDRRRCHRRRRLLARGGLGRRGWPRRRSGGLPWRRHGRHLDR